MSTVSDNLWFFATISAVMSGAYLLLTIPPVCVLMHRWNKLSLVAYMVAAFVTATPIALVCVALAELSGVAFAAIVAAIGGLLAYWIVERPWPFGDKSG